MNLRTLEAAALTVGIISAIIGAYLYLDNLHAKRINLLKTEIELRQEIVDRDIKKDAEARVYYKDISKERSLTEAEESRLEYLEETLEQKYEIQRMLREKEMELK